jgi:hypothetical protein
MHAPQMSESQGCVCVDAAALRVISRLAPETDVVVNLRGANLHKAQLRFMRGIKVLLEGADLTDANYPDDWRGAISRRMQGAADAGDLESGASNAKFSKSLRDMPGDV